MCCHPLAKGPSAGAGCLGLAGSYGSPCEGSHPVAAKVHAASAAAWSAGDA